MILAKVRRREAICRWSAYAETSADDTRTAATAHRTLIEKSPEKTRNNAVTAMGAAPRRAVKTILRS
jgi:hypothetical protein